MVSIEETFGISAGKIWQELANSNKLTESELIEICKSAKKYIYAGIGWLARENKIRKEGAEYLLGETNLTATIGTNAGKVWNILNAKGGATSVPNLRKYIKLSISEIYQALGWLAKEGKLEYAGTNKETYKLK